MSVMHSIQPASKEDSEVLSCRLGVATQSNARVSLSFVDEPVFDSD